MHEANNLDYRVDCCNWLVMYIIFRASTIGHPHVWLFLAHCTYESLIHAVKDKMCLILALIFTISFRFVGFLPRNVI